MLPFSIAAWVAMQTGIRTDLHHEEHFLDRILEDWAQDTEEFVRVKLPHLLMVALIAFVLSRVLKLVTARMIHLADQHASTPAHLRQVKTLAGVIRTTGLSIIAAIAGLQFLAAMGVDLAPLLASAGVAGVAIGLAAQNIVRDVLNGVLILVEDQLNVGDTVRVSGVSGVVETMTLRRTNLRDSDGTLHIIPNSQILQVSNLSVGSTVTTVNVSLDYSTDPDRAITMLRGIAEGLAADKEFAAVLTEPPQVLGLETVKGTELVFAVSFTTQATRQYALLREFRRRVRLQAEADGILPGDPNGLFRTALGGQPRDK